MSRAQPTSTGQEVVTPSHGAEIGLAEASITLARVRGLLSEGDAQLASAAPEEAQTILYQTLAELSAALGAEQYAPMLAANSGASRRFVQDVPPALIAEEYVMPPELGPLFDPVVEFLRSGKSVSHISRWTPRKGVPRHFLPAQS